MTHRGKLWTLWGVVALLAATLIVGGLFAFRAVRANATATAACQQVTTLNEERDDSQPVSGGAPVTVILGDSYAQGQFLDTPRDDAWSTLVGEARGWKTYIDAVGGTGFTNDGPCGGQEFAARVSDVLVHNPEVVIVQGGLNDDPATVTDAADELLDDLSTVERVIVVGPVVAPGYDLDSIKAVDDALGNVAEESGHQYVSMLDVGVEIGDDGRHMTPEGHATFAAAVLNALN